MAPELKGRGILWVHSRVSPSVRGVLSEGAFLKWYDEEHIAEVVTTGGIHNALRYVNVNKGSPSVSKPNLVIYPLEDIAFTGSKRFQEIGVTLDVAGEERVVYDVADFDIICMSLVKKTEAKDKKGTAQYVLASALEPASETSDEVVTKFYEQQTATVSKAPNYLRTLRFRLVFGRTNGQSRAWKGLPVNEDEPVTEPISWLAVHEFSAEPSRDVQDDAKKDVGDVLRKAKQNELHVYSLVKEFGGGALFD